MKLARSLMSAVRYSIRGTLDVSVERNTNPAASQRASHRRSV